MGDDGQKDKKAEKWSGSEGKDKKEKTPGLAPGLSAIKEKERESKEQTTEQTSGIRREMLETEVVGADKETAEKIASLDSTKETSEQMDKWNRLELVNYTLLPKLFDKGFKEEVLSVFESFRSIQLPADLQLNGIEKVAMKKMREIASQTASPLFLDVKKKWDAIVSKAHDAYKKAAEARDYLNKPAAKHDEPESKAPWLVQKIKEHPVAAAVCVGAAAYGVYKIFFADNKTPEGAEQSGFLDKIGLGGWKKKTLGIVLGALALGGLIGYDKIGEAMKKIANISTGNLEKAWALIKEGKLTEALAVLAGGAGTVLEEGVEKAKEGLKWVDEQIHFTELTKEISEMCIKYGIALPAWLKDINLTDIAKNLGLSLENKADWLEYAGVGGTALLLYKYTKSKAIPINVGIYMLLIKGGKEGFGGKIFSSVGKEFDEAKSSLLNKMKANDSVGNIAEALIPDVFQDFKIEKHIDNLLDLMKENPILAMGAINGLWFGRHIIVSALKIAALGIGKTAKTAITNPKTTAVVAGIVALEFGRRRFVIEDLIKTLYDDPKSKEALAMRDMLGNLVGVDFSKAPGLIEHQADDFHKSFLEDPKEALKKATTLKEYKKGTFSIFINSLGVVYYLAKGASAPIQLVGLTKESLMSLAHVYSPEYEGNVFTATVFAGMEGFIFGSMAWEGFKAYKTILLSKEMGPTTGIRLYRKFKSLVPLTQEWWFVVRSCGSGLPLWQSAMKLSDLRAINRAQENLDKIIELAEKQPAGYVEKIREHARQIRRENMLTKAYDDIYNNLSKTSNYRLKMSKDYDRVRRIVNEIDSSTMGTVDAANIKKLANEAKDNLEGVKNGTRSILTRLKLIYEGNFKEAMAMPDAATEAKLAREEAEKSTKDLEGAKPIEMKGEPFKNKDGSYKSVSEMETNAERLRKEIAELDDASPLKKTKTKELTAIEAFISPGKISGLKVDSAELAKLEGAEKAKRIESLAAELEATEKGMQSRFNAEVSNIIKEARSKGLELTDPTIMEKLEKLDKDITIPLGKNKEEMLEVLTKEYKALPGKLKTPSLIAQMRHAIGGPDGSVMTRVVKGAKGRAKMMVLMGALIFATDQAIHWKDAERDLAHYCKDIGPELGQLLLDVLPITGTFSNYYSAVSGREIVTGRDVSGTWDRASNVVWGTVSLAGDTITVLDAVPTAGASIYENIEIRLARATRNGSKAAAKLLKLWPKLAKIADKMGGWRRFAEKVAEYIKMDPAKLAKGLRTVEKVGMVAGTAMVVGGAAYHLRYAFVDTKKELNIPPELMGGKSLEEARGLPPMEPKPA